MPHHETYIAGVKFRPNAEAALAAAAPDCEFTLAPEPTNQHDPNAVKVLLGEEHVGFVPRDVAPEIGALIRADRIVRVIRRAGSKAGIEIHYREETV